MTNIKLIGISGKMGSGKDTVAQIIQILNVEPGFSNERVADLLTNFPFVLTGMTYSKKNPWLIRKFAFKLKEIASILTGIPQYKFEYQSFKKTILGPEWDSFKKEPMVVRDLLQKLGTEALRNNLHPDVWINALFNDPEFITQKWLITDVRFNNEAQAIKDREGILLRVESNLKTGSHVSETELDDATFDFIIDNRGTLEQLVEQVRNFCNTHGII